MNKGKVLKNSISSNKKIIAIAATFALTALAAMIAFIEMYNNSSAYESNKPESMSYIVQSNDYDELSSVVSKLGIKTSHQLNVINAVVAELTAEQVTELTEKHKFNISKNYSVELAGDNNGRAVGKRRWQPLATVVEAINAQGAHSVYNFGDGVTIGFLDTGLDQLSGLSVDLYRRDKAWGTYDAINDTVSNYDDEANGHGTHVASIAANSDYDVTGKIYGVAPNAALVGIKAFDYEGKATYADVIRGIQWAIQVKDQINLRVLNMSFSGPVRSFYWEDPLNQAVMKAWQAGIVVVASAGNSGPNPMTIGVPGNVPYIITVGATSDNYTTNSNVDDFVTSFSAAGPTVEGFVKPDLVAPGGHLSGLMSFDSTIVTEHPEFHDGGRYFEMSGTSQAAAVVSGAAALLLTQEPNLSPDQVKCRITSTAKMAFNDDDSLAFSVFQQGAGMINVGQMLASENNNCANKELDIAKDLGGEQHFYGPANMDENGDFYIEGLGDKYRWQASVEPHSVSGSGFIWKNSVEVGGFIWKNSVVTDGFIWKNAVFTDGFIWKNALDTEGFIWKNSLNSDGFIWKNNADFNAQEGIGVNHWVEQQ